MHKIEVMRDFSEIVPYDRAEVPLYIRGGKLSMFDELRVDCHWHDDIEWLYLTEGTVCYFVNGARILINEGDVLMVNSRQMHYGYSNQNQDCYLSCMLFHPSLFCQNRNLFQKYVTPVLENANLPYIHFDSAHPLRQEVTKCLARIFALKERGHEAYELEAIALMHTLWGRLLKEKELFAAANGWENQDDIDIQKNMVSFIYQHYGEKISLDEIASSGNVSRSKCCRIFKRYLQQSPVDFLNEYRLKASLHMLDNSDKNITEIALACGFNHLSYYSKYFYENYGMTPRDYRKKGAVKSEKPIDSAKRQGVYSF